jgi:hypothetical protein
VLRALQVILAYRVCPAIRQLRLHRLGQEGRPRHLGLQARGRRLRPRHRVLRWRQEVQEVQVVRVGPGGRVLPWQFPFL